MTNFTLRLKLAILIGTTAITPSVTAQTMVIGTDPFSRMAVLSPGQAGDVIIRTTETTRLDAVSSVPQETLSGFQVQVYSIYPDLGGAGKILSVRQIYRDFRNHQYYRIRFLAPDEMFPYSSYPSITFEINSGMVVVTFRGTEVGSWPAKIYTSAPMLETDCDNTFLRYPPTQLCPAQFFHSGGQPVRPEDPARPGEKIHAFGTGFVPRATTARIGVRYAADLPGGDPLGLGDYPLTAALSADPMTPGRFRIEFELPDATATELGPGVSTATLAISGGLPRVELFAVTR